MIPYGRQSISEEDIAAVVSALKNDFLTTGPLVNRFEEELQNIVGAPCVSVSSGTAALHCAYFAIGLEPGDEVITPPLTFIATQATAAMFGAKIVFADIQPDTGNIDPKDVERVITRRTKAIVAVDYAGHPADLDELREIANRHNIYLIQDAAHSIGSYYKNAPVGLIADLTTFSFFPTKNMTTAEGGAVSSTNLALLKRAKSFARQGLIRDKNEFQINNEGPWHQEVHEFGLNYRLPDVLCALGVSQLSKLPAFKKKRSALFKEYIDTLSGIPGLELPTVREYVDPMWHLFSVHVPSERRESLYLELHKQGYGVQVNYMPAYWHPVFQKEGLKIGDYPISDEFYRTQLSLPMHTGVTEVDVKNIGKIIQDHLNS